MPRPLIQLAESGSGSSASDGISISAIAPAEEDLRLTRSDGVEPTDCPSSQEVSLPAAEVAAHPLPGALLVDGEISPSNCDVIDWTREDLEREAQDRADVARGFARATDDKREYWRIFELGEVVFSGNASLPSHMSIDTVMQAVYIMAMFKGIPATDIPENNGSSSAVEGRFLPLVCLFLAYKSEEIERTAEASVLPWFIAAVKVPGEVDSEIRKTILKLEALVLFTIDFRVNSPTPTAFLRLFLARSVHADALQPHQTSVVGRNATETVRQWVCAGFGEDFSCSEMAAAALCHAVGSVYGEHDASAVASVVGCSRVDYSRFEPLYRDVECQPRSSPLGSDLDDGMVGGREQPFRGHDYVFDMIDFDSDTDDVTPPSSVEGDDDLEEGFHEEQARKLLWEESTASIGLDWVIRSCSERITE